jgi:hypothetical protein
MVNICGERSAIGASATTAGVYLELASLDLPSAPRGRPGRPSRYQRSRPFPSPHARVTIVELPGRRPRTVHVEGQRGNSYGVAWAGPIDRRRLQHHLSSNELRAPVARCEPTRTRPTSDREPWARPEHVDLRNRIDSGHHIEKTAVGQPVAGPSPPLVAPASAVAPTAWDVFRLVVSLLGMRWRQSQEWLITMWSNSGPSPRCLDV